MKFTISLLVAMAIVCLCFLTACKKNRIQSEVDAAIAQEQYQFIALLDDKGKWTYPEVPEVPDWYFQTTGIKIQLTKSENYEADSARMKSYNDALYQALKAQGKFHVVEENIAKIKANLDKHNAATEASTSTNSAAPKN